MKSLILAVHFACFAVVVLSREARFDNYRVYSAIVENDDQLKVLRDLENNPDGILFIEPPTATGQIADFLVPPHKLADIAELFDAFDIKNQLKTENIQE